MLRMYDVDGKVLNGINIVCVNSLFCIRVKRGDKVVSYPLGFLMRIWMQ